MATEYAFDSATDLGARQLHYLQELFDHSTRGFVGDVTAGEGQSCLDLGTGSGSVARWLAERTGPSGEVHASDLETTHVDVPPGVRVHRHDLNDGLPAEGPFDVIHTRFLLMHLKRRKEILADLADALAPGGWLVVGEISQPRTEAVAAPSPADAELFRKVIDTGSEKVIRPAGQSFEWGPEVDAEMTALGLTGIDTMEFARTTYGGTTGCLLLSNYVRQMDARMRAVGMTAGELERFHELMLDPRMRVWFFPMVYTRGRKPTSG